MAARHATHEGTSAAARDAARDPSGGVALDTGAEQFANRLRRDLRHIGRTMRRQGVTCYRLYDADLPDYNLAVDVYGEWAHVQEYAPPHEVPPALAAARLARAVTLVAAALGIDESRVVVKQRRRQRGTAQYERRGGDGVSIPVEEDGLTYLVDLTGYLDTGLFLDQRETRRLVRGLAAGRRFLNLFAYTATTTVSAIAGGALSSVSVDLSRTYLDWGARNLSANGIEGVALARWPAGPAAATAPHRLVQADCLRWIAEAEGGFDLIWLDPPTFSNSARMGGATFDVQRDHADLVRMVARRFLAPEGILLFSSNRRGFTLDAAALAAAGLLVADLSRSTLPPDFARAARSHHVFRIARET